MVENRGISLFRANALYLLAAVGLVLLDLAATLLSSIEGLNTGAASVFRPSMGREQRGGQIQ